MNKDSGDQIPASLCAGVYARVRTHVRVYRVTVILDIFVLIALCSHTRDYIVKQSGGFTHIICHWKSRETLPFQFSYHTIKS